MTKKGEIWIASLEPKKGAEVGKQRPVLIIQTDLLNEIDHPTVIVLPVSSQAQKDNVLRFKIEKDFLDKKIGFILVDQPRSIDSSFRLQKYIGELTYSEIKTVNQLIKQVLDLD